MSDERPEALLRSALEKIVYFEARSKQLENDVASANAEAERLRKELAQAAQREIELRRSVASLEVEVARAHREREEVARTNEALRSERVALLDQILEASRIHSADRPGEDDGGIDLASFIAQLRSEVLTAGSARSPLVATGDSTRPGTTYSPAVPVVSVASPEPALAVAVARSSSAHAAVDGATNSSLDAAPQRAQPAPPMSAVAAHAERLHAAGRLHVSHEEMARLSGASAFPGRTEETLFGFSVRELSAPDPAARARAADRLRALRQSAAAPALATALNAETDPSVQVALLHAFAEVASKEGAAIVLPLLDAKSADVRITALKTLLSLDPQQAGPHLSAAMKDADRAVRRRASLLALGLAGDAALALGEQALADGDAEVRSLGALVLGASADDRARELLLSALRDSDKKVRKAAAQSLSRILGEDVSGVVELDEPQRRREVRRLAAMPARPVRAMATSPAAPAQVAPASAAVGNAVAAPAAMAGGIAAPASAANVVAAPAAANVVAAPTAMATAVAAQGPSRSGVARPGYTAAISGPAPVAAHSAPASRTVPAAHPASSAQAELARQVEAVVSPRRAGAERGVAAHGNAVGVEPVCTAVMGELRISIRGRTLAELVSITGEAQAAVVEACELLVARGQAVRRGTKFFAA